MTSDLWAALPAAVRDKVDELVVQGRSVQAVFAIRSSGVTPRPGLRACQELTAERGTALADRMGPPSLSSLSESPQSLPPLPQSLPPLRDVETLAAEVRALPRPVVAIEADMGGDTEGWNVRLVAVMADPAEVHVLAHLRAVEGEATTTGQALAGRFGVPFRYDESGGPGLPSL